MKKDNQLISLIESSQTLTSTLDLDVVLQRLITEVMYIIDYADAGVLYLYDAKSGKLKVGSVAGFDMTYMKHIFLEPNEAMSGKTFISKQASIFTFKEDTTKGMSNLYENNQLLYQKALGELNYPTSTICAPLMSKDECIGVLTIDSFSNQVHFTKDDLQILEIFASQSVIAIENATLFSQNQRFQSINHELMKVNVKHEGVNKITQTLSEIVQKEVCLFNEFYDVLSSSSNESKIYSSELKTKYFYLLEEVAKQKEVENYTLELNETVNCYFFPIKVDKSIIGILTIFLGNDDTLDPIDLFAIEQVHSVFALELTREQGVIDTHIKYESYLLEQVLSNRFEAFNKNFNKNSETANDTQYVFVKLELNNLFIPIEQLTRNIKQFRRLIYRELSNFRLKAFVLEQSMIFKILIVNNYELNETAITHEIERLFRKITNRSKELDLFTFWVGIGREFLRIEDIHSSVRDADRCVQFLKHRNNLDSIISYKRLGVYRLFLNQDKEELNEFVQDLIGPILLYDKENGTQLLETAKVYLEMNGNLRETAELCFVHINTVKYRLNKVRELLGQESLTGVQRFELQLAIYSQGFLENN
ncbi:helix-turn-helix domain-containing protein [Lentibacillus persicus]|nr:helix-turn-helix domain-containing protein [Lentibacillus persicus]